MKNYKVKRFVRDRSPIVDDENYWKLVFTEGLTRHPDQGQVALVWALYCTKHGVPLLNPTKKHIEKAFGVELEEIWNATW